MTDNTIYTGNKPDLYFQQIIKHPDGKTEFKDVGAMWNKANYATGTLKVGDTEIKMIARTQEQRQALFAMRKQQKEQAQSQGQTVQQEQPNTPQL